LGKKSINKCLANNNGFNADLAAVSLFENVLAKKEILSFNTLPTNKAKPVKLQAVSKLKICI